MTPVQAGVAPGVWPATGWFAVPDASLAALYDVMLTGQITVGVHDIGAGDQYFDFTQGLAVDVIEIPIQPPVDSSGGASGCFRVPPARPVGMAGAAQILGALTRTLISRPAMGRRCLYALMVEMFDEYPGGREEVRLRRIDGRGRGRGQGARDSEHI